MKRSITLTAALLSSLAILPAASAESPVSHTRDQWSFGPDADDACGIPVSVTGEGRFIGFGRAGGDVTLPDKWIYGHINVTESVTLTSATGAVTETRRLVAFDQARTYQETAGVIVSLYRERDTFTTRDDGTGRVLARSTGTFLYRVTTDTTDDDPADPSTLGIDVDVLSTTGTLDSYFDGWCDAVAASLG